MTEKEALATALSLAAEGKTEQASGMFLQLLHQARDSVVGLRAALGLLGTVNSVENNQVLLEACEKGLELAARLRKADVRSFLMAKKAVCLSFATSQCRYRRRLLRLAPSWKGFALEADQNEFQRLTKLIDNGEAESNELIESAIRSATETGDIKTLAHVLMLRGELQAARYLDLKLEHLKDSVGYRLFKFLKLAEFGYPRQVRLQLRGHLTEFRGSYLESARLFQSLGDESTAAAALYNLANNMRSINRFAEAGRFLARVRIIANRLNDRVLLSRVDVLAERIRTRNSNIPNYARNMRQ